jgi:arsenate reductase
MTILYGINNCDTIKKTRKWLQENKIDYNFHDYKKAGCPQHLAEIFLKNFSYKELINRRGTTWRKLSDHEKASLDITSAIKLMVERPSIIKRPLLNSGKIWLLGYNEEIFKQLAHSTNHRK